MIDTWNKIKRYLPIIGIVIFVYFLIKLNVVKILGTMLSANPFYLIVALILTFFMLILMTYKWYFIARKQKINIPFWKAFKINLIGDFYGFITPSKLGSAIRIEYLKKYAGGFGRGISNFILDKVLDVSSVFFLAIIFVSAFDFLQFNIGYLTIIFLVFIFCFFIFTKKERARVLLRVFYKRLLPRRLKTKTKILFESFYENFPKKRDLLVAFGINIATWTLTYIIMYFVGLSLGIDLKFVYYLAILPITTIIAQLPITINGLGTREAAMIGFFSLFGIDPVKIFSMSVLTLLITGILPAIFTAFLLLKKQE